MDTLLLAKDKLKDFLKSISNAQLLAPIVKNGRTSFEVIENPDAAELNLNDYTATIKKAAFPQDIHHQCPLPGSAHRLIPAPCSDDRYRHKHSPDTRSSRLPLSSMQNPPLR